MMIFIVIIIAHVCIIDMVFVINVNVVVVCGGAILALPLLKKARPKGLAVSMETAGKSRKPQKDCWAHGSAQKNSFYPRIKGTWATVLKTIVCGHTYVGPSNTYDSN